MICNTGGCFSPDSILRCHNSKASLEQEAYTDAGSFLELHNPEEPCLLNLPEKG